MVVFFYEKLKAKFEFFFVGWILIFGFLLFYNVCDEKIE